MFSYYNDVHTSYSHIQTLTKINVKIVGLFFKVRNSCLRYPIHNEGEFSVLPNQWKDTVRVYLHIKKITIVFYHRTFREELFPL